MQTSCDVNMRSFIVYLFAADSKVVRTDMCRRVLTSEEKNVVLKTINEDLTHTDVGKYIRVSRSCITRF